MSGNFEQLDAMLEQIQRGRERLVAEIEAPHRARRIARLCRLRYLDLARGKRVVSQTTIAGWACRSRCT